MKRFIYISFSVFIFSCGNTSEKNKETSNTVPTVQESSEQDDEIDLFADLEEDGWEMDEETRDGLENLEKFLEGVENFSIESNYEMLLNKHQLNRGDLNRSIEAITQERLGRGDGTNAQEEAAAYAVQLQGKMKEAGLGMTLEEAESLVAAYNASADQKLTSKYKGTETEKEIHSILQKQLGNRPSGFIEENLNTYQTNNNKERLSTLRKLAASTSEMETRNILLAYYEISDKELLLLEKFPKVLEKLPSEKIAIKSRDYQLPKAIEDHLKKGLATPKFRELIVESLAQKKELATTFISEANKARKKFYTNNPSWFQNEEGVDNTYIDERGNFVFLPLGDLAFADAVVKEQLGTSGAHAEGAIGIPDMSTKRFKEVDPKICNLGLKGQLTVAFTNNALSNVNGPDLYIFEMGAIEPTHLEISKNGNDWIAVGKIEGGTAAVDIEPFVKEGDSFNYVRLTDLETPSGIPGADIDAVAAIGGAMLLSLDSSVLFDSGSYELKELAHEALEKLANQIKTFPKGTISVNGHTDSDGSATSNSVLSKNRAKAVANALEQHLSKDYKFTIEGYGASHPLVPNTTKENKQKNRRVEILITPTNQ